MTQTNYGNKYKFNAIHERRSTKTTVDLQAKKKNGEWGKPVSYNRYGNETDEQVCERMIQNNNKEYRIIEGE